MNFHVEKWHTGVYRVRLKDDNGNLSHMFGQIRKNGRKWHAEIRHTDTGDLIRYAGIWDTLKEATEEIHHILSPAPVICEYTACLEPATVRDYVTATYFFRLCSNHASQGATARQHILESQW